MANSSNPTKIIAVYDSRSDAEEAQQRLRNLKGARVPFKDGPDIEPVGSKAALQKFKKGFNPAGLDYPLWVLTATIAGGTFERLVAGNSNVILHASHPRGTSTVATVPVASMAVENLGNAVLVDVS